MLLSILFALTLWIAAASFFLGQADELPEALRILPLLCTPLMLVFLLMFYWLVRVLFTQWRPQAQIYIAASGAE